MPIVSPSRYTTSTGTISGSYRSTLSTSSSLDKPYYRTSSGSSVSSTPRSSVGDKITDYRSRYYPSLVEYSRNSRVTVSDSGISSRYRSERSETRSPDVSSTRSESSTISTDALPRNRRNCINAGALIMATAELYNKYSPKNYIPLAQRIRQQYREAELPAADPTRAISEVPEERRFYRGISPTPSYRKGNSMTTQTSQYSFIRAE